MVTDIIILVLLFKYLIGRFHSKNTTESIITDSFLALRISMREKIPVILLMSLGGL
jgi:hypothetical protein